jgi:hypothetical protein
MLVVILRAAMVVRLRVVVQPAAVLQAVEQPVRETGEIEEGRVLRLVRAVSPPKIQKTGINLR